MLYIGNFRDIKPEKYDQIWVVVRRLTSKFKNPLNNIHHVDIIAPSQSLLFDTLDMKRKNQWNQETFDKIYTPRYLSEMTQPGPKAKLQELAELSKTQDILVVCYCTNENECHRSLIKKIIDYINSN